MVPINVPNVLTVIRILLVPVLVVALLENSSDVTVAITVLSGADCFFGLRRHMGSGRAADRTSGTHA